MNYYKRHLGDYARDTRHLTLAEHGAYTLLLDYYYATERPIPDDRCERIANAYADSERQAVRNVLREFFMQTDDGWRHERADAVIQEAGSKSLKAKESAERRWKQTQSDGNANAMRTQCDGNASHYSTTPLDKSPPKPPKGGTRRERSITLADYLAQCEAGRVDPIPANDGVWKYPETMGLPGDWIPLAWWAFQGRYLAKPGEKAKRYTSWPQTFRNAVRENWLRLWFTRDGKSYELTTTGHQALAEMRTER